MAMSRLRWKRAVDELNDRSLLKEMTEIFPPPAHLPHDMVRPWLLDAAERYAAEHDDDEDDVTNMVRGSINEMRLLKWGTNGK
jgi:hypothetical protein